MSGVNRKAPKQQLAPTIERGRRCQSCIHFDNGPLALQHYKACRHRDMEAAAAKVLSGENVPPAMRGERLSDDEKTAIAKGVESPQDLMTKLGLNYELGDTLMRQGQIGVCKINAAPGDFVHFAYLCGKWEQRVKPDDADKPDELPEDARKRIYGDDA